MRVIVSVLSVLLMVAVSCSGQTLECFQCTLGFWDMCATTKINCSAGDQCFVGIGSAASVLDVKMMGCLPKEACNKTTTVEFPRNKTIYTMTRQCCNENYCNHCSVFVPSFTIIVLTIAQTISML